jgi:hypoxanthine phosphoribosyltransferase
MPQPPSKHVVVRGERFRVHLSRDELRLRVAEMGQQITRDYAGKRPIFIGVLNGAIMFMADLLRAVDLDCEIDFLKLSSYGAEKVSSGNVTALKGIDADLEGRHVIFVEDIVDTGLSMQFIQNMAQKSGAASVAVATLLHKHEATRVDLVLDYVGYRIPNKFVIGYGLDWGQIGRNLADLYILDEPDTR